MPVQPENVIVLPEALAPGTEVGTWRVLRPLGAGGMGAAYLVEDADRPGEFYAMKLPTHWDDGWAEREMRLLAERAVHPNVVRLHSWGRWPHPRTGRPYIIMDWVPGLPAHTWAESYNPPIREVVEKFATIALVLDDLHGRGLLHRDLKPEHLIIREPDGRPLMIDFGVGWYAGAEPLTTQILAPGTPHLRSPESVHFWRTHERKPGARYVYTPADDLYALAVSAWRVLTGHWPFPPHLPRDILFGDIESAVPPNASEVNRRLPRAISEVLDRMLAKDPSYRYASGKDLHMAWVAALAYAGSSAVGAELFVWDRVPEEKRKREEPVWRIRRPEWPTQSSTPPAPRPQSPAAQPEAPEQVLNDGAASPALPSPLSQASRERRTRGRAGRLLLYAGLLSVGLGALGALGMAQRGIPSRVGENPPEPHPTSQVGQKSTYPAGQKLAESPARAESEEVAVPPRAELTPAAVVPPTTHPKDEPAVKNTPVTPKNEQPQQRSGSMSRKVGLVTCATLACAGAPVRHPPPPEECPPGAVEVMKARKWFFLSPDLQMSVPGVTSGGHITVVKEGPFVFRTGVDWGKEFNVGKAYSRLYFGADGRVYGRIYEVESKKGERFPFCGELYDAVDLKRGLIAQEEITDTAKILSDPFAFAVTSFK